MTKSNSIQKTEKLNYSEIGEKIQGCLSTLQDYVSEIYGLIDDLGLKFNKIQCELEDLEALHKTGKPHISEYVRELDLEELLKYSANQAMGDISEHAMKACATGVTEDGLAKTVPNTVKKRKAPTKKTKSIRKPNNRK